jgi:HK97 family phage prohead protease
MDIERRFYQAEIRLVEEGSQAKIIGYGAVFNQVSEDLGGFREIVRPGAFAQAIRDDDVRALFNHDPSAVLGRNRAGTLKLVEDDLGLRYEIIPPDTQMARDLLVSLKRGDVNQSSFGFTVENESWQPAGGEQDLPIRLLHRVKLFDVSPVTFPAYPTTSVAVRDHLAAIKEKQDILLSRAAERARAEAAGRLNLRRHRLELIKLKK